MIEVAIYCLGSFALGVLAGWLRGRAIVAAAAVDERTGLGKILKPLFDSKERTALTLAAHGSAAYQETKRCPNRCGAHLASAFFERARGVR